MPKINSQSHGLAFFGKPGRCTRTTQKRGPVGACITTSVQVVQQLGA